MNDLVHLALEGLFAALLAVAGFFLKSLWGEIRDLRREKDDEIRELRDKLGSLKDDLSAFKLQVEKDFVKHGGLAWIEQKLEKFEKILDDIRLSMARHRREDEQ